MWKSVNIPPIRLQERANVHEPSIADPPKIVKATSTIVHRFQKTPVRTII